MNVFQIDPQDSEMLDAIYELHSSQWIPQWATCAAAPPYPTREHLDSLAVAGRFRFFGCSGTFNDVLDGYLITNLGGKPIWSYVVTPPHADEMTVMDPRNVEQQGQLYGAALLAGGDPPRERIDNPLIDAVWDEIMARAAEIAAG